MTSDDRLKALYRAATSRGAPADIDADTLAQVLQRSGWPDEENTPLDRVAASALHADIVRLAMELGPEAEALAREVNALRKPQAAPARHPGAARSWMALAAGVGAAALLIAGLGQLPSPQTPVDPMGSDAILSASFENGDDGQADPAPAEPDAIFGGGFDS